MECRGMGLTAVHYSTLNLYHCRENDARCIVIVGIGFSVVYRKRKKVPLTKVISPAFLSCKISS